MEQIRLIEPTDLEDFGPQAAFVLYLLALINVTADVRLNRPIPPEDLIDTCRLVGIKPLPENKHQASRALLAIAPGLMRVFRAPFEDEVGAFQYWRKAVEEANHDDAHRWLLELGLWPRTREEAVS